MSKKHSLESTATSSDDFELRKRKCSKNEVHFDAKQSWFFVIVDVIFDFWLLKLQSMDAQLTEFQMSQAEYIWYLDTFSSSEPGSRLIIGVESVMKEVFGDDWETKLNEKWRFYGSRARGDTTVYAEKPERGTTLL